MLKNISIIILNVFLFTSCLQLDDDVVTELQSPEEPEWVFITKSDGLAQDTVTTMLKDSNGYFWFGHFNKGITRWDGENEFKKFSVEQGLTDNWITRIAEAPDGRIWVATNKGYNIIDGNDIVAYEYYNYTVTDIIFPKPGTVWLSSQVGIYVFSSAGDSLIFDKECYYCSPSMKLLIDRDDNIWVASLEDVRRLNAADNYRVDKRYPIPSRDNLPLAFVTEIFEDDSGSIFGGSLFAQFNTFKLTDSEPQFFDFSTISIVGVSAITSYNNQLWVGTRGAGVIKTNGSSISLFLDELPNPIVFDLMNDGQSIWIATLGVAKHTAR